jgi:hypothetical protein
LVSDQTGHDLRQDFLAEVEVAHASYLDRLFWVHLFDTPISAANVRWLHQNPGQYDDPAPATFAAGGVPL